jgi:hypothetical protein
MASTDAHGSKGGMFSKSDRSMREIHLIRGREVVERCVLRQGKHVSSGWKPEAVMV